MSIYLPLFWQDGREDFIPVIDSDSNLRLREWLAHRDVYDGREHSKPNTNYFIKSSKFDAGLELEDG